MMKRVWGTIDRWGPGVLAIITFFVVIVVSWQYDRRLSAVQARHEAQIEDLQKQINRLEHIRIEPEVYEFKLKQTNDRISTLQSQIDFEAAKAQNLRERLMKKGWVE